MSTGFNLKKAKAWLGKNPNPFLEIDFAFTESFANLGLIEPLWYEWTDDYPDDEFVIRRVIENYSWRVSSENVQ